ncbi:MAG: DUF4914 family protein [Pirellulaceae bacterium]
MLLEQLRQHHISRSAMAVLRAADEVGQLTIVESVEHLAELAVPADRCDPQGYFTVGYDVPGRGFIPEARVCRVRNGVSANYLEPYMRRRDAECMVIADEKATDKPTFKGRFGTDFAPLRQDTLDWLKSQPIACFFFESGLPGQALNALAICPANAGFFALGLAMLQGIKPLSHLLEQGEGYRIGAIVYTAPVFRHTHFGGKQVVVHNRRQEEVGLHELFSYNLYPGPSAKKGVYGMLLTLGERAEVPWTTAHCSTVQVVTPYDNTTTIMHEGASGGGKSEMLEVMHREPDGQVRLGTNTVTGDQRFLTMPRGCDLRPVTDDMALCHPKLQNNDGSQGRLTLIDAEQGWFVRVNHISRYGTDPNLEGLTINPPGPLLFLNIDAVPNSTALIWEHTEDAPGSPCPNPRVILPRHYIPGVVNEPVTVGIRSFGVRCPPCTRLNPTYGILGLFHVLPPALAWLWRLVAPRGHGNPSIVSSEGMQSEGVGSYWPFATGRRVDQANILLRQIMETATTRFVLIPNQHIGSWNVGFAPQWVAREYLARRGTSPFRMDELMPSRCPLLGYHRQKIQVEGQTVGTWFFDVSSQPEVGVEAYDTGAQALTEFFHRQLLEFQHPELDPLGRKMIQACLDKASVQDYDSFAPAS